MINEEMTQKECNLAVRVGSLLVAEIKKALDKIMADLEQIKNNPMDKSTQPNKQSNKHDKSTQPKTPDLKHGKMTLKQLHKHGDGLASIELKDPNLRQLKSSMKKADIDFSVLKDGKGKYTLFFKGKNAEEMTYAIKQYTEKMVTRTEKKEIKAELKEAKAAAKTINTGRDKVKNVNIDKGAR